MCRCEVHQSRTRGVRLDPLGGFLAVTRLEHRHVADFKRPPAAAKNAVLAQVSCTDTGAEVDSQHLAFVGNCAGGAFPEQLQNHVPLQLDGYRKRGSQFGGQANPV